MTARPNRLAVFSWVLYDFANTIFSMNVISLYFALWVTVDKGGSDFLYSVTLSGSMLAVACSMPVFGIISDQTGKHHIYLALLTTFCSISTALIGLADELTAGLLFFFLANFCYQSSMVFYNGMLPVVSRGSHIGLLSGLGVGTGYLGSIVGLVVVKPFVTEGGRTAAFLPTAAMFLFFALPCCLFVKDSKKFNSAPINFRVTFATLKKTLIEAQRYHHLIRFVCIHFLVLDVVNTIIVFMSIYANKVIGFGNSEINSFMIIATVAAMIGSFVLGWVVKVRGSYWAYSLVLSVWVVTLIIAIFSHNESIFWVVGTFAGIGMGGVWVVSRTLLIELCPKEKIGEFFGLYGLAGKMSSIVGPLIWGATVSFFEKTQTFKYRAAVAILLLIALGAASLYRSLLDDLRKENKLVDTSGSAD